MLPGGVTGGSKVRVIFPPVVPTLDGGLERGSRRVAAGCGAELGSGFGGRHAQIIHAHETDVIVKFAVEGKVADQLHQFVKQGFGRMMQ